jgi:hypothetical protein
MDDLLYAGSELGLSAEAGEWNSYRAHEGRVA